MTTSMKSLGLLINCDDVEQRFHLLSCIMDLYKGLNIFATTPQEGWDVFADDVFERFILLNELGAEQRNQLRYLQCIGFEKCIETVDSGSGSNISIMEINNDGKESKTASGWWRRLCVYTIAAIIWQRQKEYAIARLRKLQNSLVMIFLRTDARFINVWSHI